MHARHTREPREQGVRLLRQRMCATLIWAAATFIGLQVGLRVVIDYWRPEFRDPAFEIKARRLQQALARSARPPVTVVAVGSSITGDGFQAKLLENLLAGNLHRPTLFFNMNSMGSGPLTDLIWVRRLLDRGIRPNLVVIELAPIFFGDAGTPTDISRFPPHILEGRDLDVIQRYGRDADLQSKWWACWLATAHGHRLTILNCTAKFLLPTEDKINLWGSSDERFWTALEPLSPADLQERLPRLKEYFTAHHHHYRVGETSLNALKELLVLLKKEKVPAAIVKMPEGPTLRNAFPVDQLIRLNERVMDLARQQDCYFVDAFEWLGDEDFTDCYHATRKGASTFSRRFAAEFLLPVMAQIVP